MIRNIFTQFLVMIVIGALQGCESGNDYNEHAAVPPSIDKKISAVPSDAQIVAATPNALSFRAPADGIAYLYDVTNKKTINAQRIGRGQLYNVDLERSMVRFGERSEPETQLLPLVQGVEYRIYFSPAQKDEAQAR